MIAALKSLVTAYSEGTERLKKNCWGNLLLCVGVVVATAPHLRCGGVWVAACTGEALGEN